MDLCLNAYTGVPGVHMEVENYIPFSLNFANRKWGRILLWQQKYVPEGETLDEFLSQTESSETTASGDGIDDNSVEIDQQKAEQGEKIMKASDTLLSTGKREAENQQRKMQLEEMISDNDMTRSAMVKPKAVTKVKQ